MNQAPCLPSDPRLTIPSTLSPLEGTDLPPPPPTPSTPGSLRGPPLGVSPLPAPSPQAHPQPRAREATRANRETALYGCSGARRSPARAPGPSSRQPTASPSEMVAVRVPQAKQQGEAQTMAMACVRPQQEERLGINLCGSRQSPGRPGAGVGEEGGIQTNRHRQARKAHGRFLPRAGAQAPQAEDRARSPARGPADSPTTLLSRREGEEQGDRGVTGCVCQARLEPRPPLRTPHLRRGKGLLGRRVGQVTSRHCRAQAWLVLWNVRQTHLPPPRLSPAASASTCPSSQGLLATLRPGGSTPRAPERASPG